MNVPQTSLEPSHFPVMLKEVIKICPPEKGGNFVDCTFGGGRYSEELLKFPNTKVTALDRDKSVEKKAREISEKYLDRFSFYNEKFSDLDKVLKSHLGRGDILLLGIDGNCRVGSAVSAEEGMFLGE